MNRNLYFIASQSTFDMLFMVDIKGKRRVIAKTYFNANVLYLLQVYERNCFKAWLTVVCTTNKPYADKWSNV